MNTAKTIAKNTVTLISAEVISKGLMFIFVVYLARILGEVEFGRYSFAFAFTTIFSMVVDLGLDPLIVREISRDKKVADKYSGGFLIIRSIAAVVTITLIAVTINLMDYPQDTKTVVYIIGAYVILNSITAILRSIFQAFERMEYMALTRILDRTLIVSLGLLVLFSGRGLIGVASVFLLTGVIIFLISFFICVKKFVKPDIHVDMAFLKSSIQSGLPFVMFAVFGVIFFNIDTVMLSVIKNDAVVGWYNAAYQIIAALLFIPGMFMFAVYPVMSKYFKTSKETLVLVYEKSFKYLIIAAIPIGVGTTILAEKIILLVYGPQFMQSVTTLKFLIWSGALLFPNYMFFGLLAAIYKEKARLWISVSCAVLNISLNMILIPPLSLVGAAISTTLTQVVLFFLSYYFVSKFFYRLNIIRATGRPIVAGLLMGLVVYFMESENLFLVIPVAACLYLAFLYILKVFSKEERILLERVFDVSR